MKVLVSGGAGFIGVNTAVRLARRGDDVVVIDNLSRLGSKENWEWLKSQDLVELVESDIRDSAAMDRLFRENSFEACIHLAAQVAVTTSVASPRHDFDVNLNGTFNILEAIRLHSPETRLLFASTNKVYGEFTADRPLIESEKRYDFNEDWKGINESQPLDFHSPYGCSKGAADQYVHDYARIYGLKTTVLRQSCIYGYRQFGIEDQGWVAWFIIASILGRPITIYGDGKQVRDILFIDDLTDLYARVIDGRHPACTGVYNVGGGPGKTLSLLELLDTLERIRGEAVAVSYADWRPGDQKIYVSDISSLASGLAWSPRIDVDDGIEKLYKWCYDNRGLFEQLGL